MSDRAIELFIRMHLEKTPRVMDRQRGRQNLTGDVIIAAMGAVQHQRPVGSDLIMARWLDDTSAALRVEKWLEKEAVQYEVIRTDLLIHLVPVALLIFLGKPTDDQIRKLSSLWRKSSERGRRSRRLMKQYLSHIESLEREKFRYEVSPSRETVINDEIDRYTLLIENEKQRINDWATTQARKSYQCPNCHGAGATSKSVVCPECGEVESLSRQQTMQESI